MTSAEPSLRADKWLWQARFFRSRSRAAAVVAAGHLRVNGQRAGKAATPVRPGDTLTFPQGGAVRVVRILDLGRRRGPASEAETLYADVTPVSCGAVAAAQRQGRPERDARRAARAFKQGQLE